MSLSGLLLGLIDVAIVVAVMLLVGAVIVWFMNSFGYPVPANVQKLYLAIVALVALYEIVALLFGMPFIHIIGPASYRAL
jgi:hypothetical protein